MIIDTHVHFGEALHFNMPQSNVIEAMDKYNISTAIVSNTHSSECDFDQKLLPPSLQTSMIESAIEAIKFAKDYPKKIYAAIWVKPLQEKPSAELFQLIKQNKNFVKAIKFHPFHSSIPFDDPKCEEFIQMAKELNLPVITHSANDRCSECKRVLNMAKKYPSVSFVMAHMGLGTNNEAAIQMCRQQENLFGDTAWVPFENTIKFIKDVGSEKNYVWLRHADRRN